MKATTDPSGDDLNSDRAICPSCLKPCNLKDQAALLQCEEIWYHRDMAATERESPLAPLRDGLRRLAGQNTGKWFWACDGCLKEKKALAADPRKQRYGTAAPFAAYVDRVFRCDDCGEEFIFSAVEQQHWFESLRFWIWVYPRQCLPCRRLRHAKAALNDQLYSAQINFPLSAQIIHPLRDF